MTQKEIEREGRLTLAFINTIVLAVTLVGVIVLPNFTDKMTCIGFMCYAGYVVLDCLEHAGIIKSNDKV